MCNKRLSLFSTSRFVKFNHILQVRAQSRDRDREEFKEKTCWITTQTMRSNDGGPD